MTSFTSKAPATSCHSSTPQKMPTKSPSSNREKNISSPFRAPSPHWSFPSETTTIYPPSYTPTPASTSISMAQDANSLGHGSPTRPLGWSSIPNIPEKSPPQSRCSEAAPSSSFARTPTPLSPSSMTTTTASSAERKSPPSHSGAIAMPMESVTPARSAPSPPTASLPFQPVGKPTKPASLTAPTAPPTKTAPPARLTISFWNPNPSHPTSPGASHQKGHSLRQKPPQPVLLPPLQGHQPPEESQLKQ